tara:strand:+ start:1470 stop:1691 length:222 start_codon:yes stop_codon:yes gene_type:complete
MKHMTRSYPPENAMLRPHKESTLEKQQKKRQNHNPPLELEDNGILNKKANERMKRKEALSKAMNKYHDVDIVG